MGPGSASLDASLGLAFRRALSPFHPANVPRPPPFMAVRRSVDNAPTCHDHPFQFAVVRVTALPKLSPICRLSAGALRRPRALTPPARPSQAVVTDAAGRPGQGRRSPEGASGRRPCQRHLTGTQRTPGCSRSGAQPSPSMSTSRETRRLRRGSSDVVHLVDAVADAVPRESKPRQKATGTFRLLRQRVGE